MAIDEHRVQTVMFTDIQGFSAMMSLDEATTVRVVREHRTIVRAALAAHGGREMRTVGDAFLVLFDAAADALACAEAIQSALAVRNGGLSVAEQVWVRVGLHAGAVLIGAEGELYGESVNIAARVEPLAAGGGLCVTAEVLAEAGVRPEPSWERLGAVPLKNIPEPRVLYRRSVAAPPGGQAGPALSWQGNVPARRGAVLGREATLVQLRAELADAHRILTLIGPGGIGKTTVLEELGRTVGPGWPGGVWFVSLVEVVDLAGVGLAVAQALALHRLETPVVQLGPLLRARGPTLLLLDNAEQAVADVAACVARWVDEAPELAVVTTSREMLALAAERVVVLDALSPEDAMALFVERARAVRPTLAIDAEARARIAELVERVDRLPLAIELLASRLRLESLDRVSRSLDGLLDVRTHRRDAPRRQVSLRAAIEGSWERLTPSAQHALAALTVFKGPIPVEAAEAAVGEPEADVEADGANAASAAELLAALVDQSLLRVVEDGLGLYVSIRAFAAERLPPAPAVYRRLAEHLVDWDARARPGSLGAHRDTFAAVFAVLVAQPPAEDEIAARLWLAWHRQGQIATPLAVLEAAAAQLPASVSPTVSARIAIATLELLTDSGRPREALAQGPRALALAEASGDAGLVGQALNVWAHAAARTSEKTLEAELLERALSLPLPDLVRVRTLELVGHQGFGKDTTTFRSQMREALDLAAGALPDVERRVLHNEGVLLIGEARDAEAIATFREVVSRCAAAGDAMGEAAARAVMAQALNWAGEHTAARAVAGLARAEAAALGVLRWKASATTALAVAQAALGEASAAATAAEALALARAAGDDAETLLAWAFQAWTLALLGDAAGADASVAEARGLAESLGIGATTHYRRALEHAAAARARLG